MSTANVGDAHLLRAVVDSAPEFIVWTAPDSGSFLNAVAARMTGFEGASARSLPKLSDLFTHASGLIFDSVATPAVKNTGSWRGPLALSNRITGETTTLDLELFEVCDASGAVLGTAGVGRDITDQQQTLEHARAVESRFRSLFEVSPLGIAVFDDNLTLTQANPAMVAMTGHDLPSLIGQGLDVLLSPLSESEPAVSTSIARLEAPSLECLLPGEDRPRQVNLTASWIPLNEDRTDRLLVMLEDISERFAARERLRLLAAHDDLTALANRSTLLDAIARAQSDTVRAKTTFALIYIDIDHFKSVNDTLGHDSGDVVLRTVAARLRTALRPGDLPARIGGDEFAVLCPWLPADADLAEALATNISARVMAALRVPVQLGDNHAPLSIAASVGVVVASGSALSAEALVAQADAAMYRAKSSGRGRVQLFDAGLRDHHDRNTDLVAGLRSALARDEFRVFYQPIVDTSTREVRGFEALLRWEHPTEGLLIPGEFLALAEATGLMHDIGGWVIRQATADLAGWIAAGAPSSLFVSLNLADAQLSPGDLPSQVSRARISTGLSPENVWLEIVETVALAGRDRQQLLELSATGVSLALDDFGTGHASLTHLRDLPVVVAKIDRVFVADLGVRPDALTFLTAIVSLAHTLGRQVVAEGVETEDQHDLICLAGCDLAQGFLYGRAVSAAASAELAREVFTH